MPTAPPVCIDAETADDKSLKSILEHAPITLNDHTVDVSEASSRNSRVWLKLDLLVLPIVAMLSCLAGLDQGNVGNARIAGLQQALGMTDEQVRVRIPALAMMVGCIAPVFIQIPSNYLMTVVGAHILCPTIIIIMGLSGAMQGVVATYPAFLVCRILTGLFPGALIFGILVYLTYFYPRRMLQVRLSVLYSTAILVLSTSSLLAAGIVRLDGAGKRPGYAWLFLLEGAACLIYGVMCLFIMPKRPTSVFLLSEKEKQYVTRVLAEDNLSAEAVDHRKFWYELRRSLVQPHVLLLSLASFLSDITSSGIAVFLPSIVVGLGFEGSKAQLMSFPPHAFGAICSLLSSLVSDRYSCRGATIIVCTTVAVSGFAIFLASDRTLVRYIALSLAVSGTSSTQPALAAWLTNNTAPFLRRTSAIAFSATVMQLGAIFSSWLYGPISPPPAYTSATIVMLVCHAGVILCAIIILVYLVIENRRKKSAREAYMLQHGERPPQETSIPNESIWFEYVL